MPGRKKSPNHGKLHGIRPKTAAPNFKAGEKRTHDAAVKGGLARKAQFARFKSLREAAEALRDVQAADVKKYPNTSNGVALVMAQFASAQGGDAKSATFLANLLGEMTQKVEMKELPTIVDDVPRAPDPTPAPEGGES